MDITITDDHENKLFQRREIAAHAVYEGKTPTRAEVSESVCKKLNLNPDTFQIIAIDQNYGIKTSEIMAYSYSSKEAMQKFARKEKEKKAKPGAAPPAKAEEKKEAKKEAAAKEEKKEEKKE
jgi:ribosomal protein S24E